MLLQLTFDECVAIMELVAGGGGGGGGGNPSCWDDVDSDAHFLAHLPHHVLQQHQEREGRV